MRSGKRLIVFPGSLHSVKKSISTVTPAALMDFFFMNLFSPALVRIDFVLLELVLIIIRMVAPFMRGHADVFLEIPLERGDRGKSCVECYTADGFVRGS